MSADEHGAPGIVQEIARAHGGTVEVCSTEADGTTFTVWLPRHGVGA